MAVRQPKNAIALLKVEHQQVRDLCRHYATATDPDTQRQIARAVCAAFALYAQLEKTVFYPAFHAVTDEEGKQLVAEALAAHRAVQELMEDLQDPDVDFVVFDARVHGLMDTMEAHMAAEEHALFPFAAEDLADQLDDLWDEMVELKQHLTTSGRQ